MKNGDAKASPFFCVIDLMDEDFLNEKILYL